MIGILLKLLAKATGLIFFTKTALTEGTDAHHEALIPYIYIGAFFCPRVEFYFPLPCLYIGHSSIHNVKTRPI